MAGGTHVHIHYLSLSEALSLPFLSHPSLTLSPSLFSFPSFSLSHFHSLSPFLSFPLSHPPFISLPPKHTNKQRRVNKNPTREDNLPFSHGSPLTPRADLCVPAAQSKHEIITPLLAYSQGPVYNGHGGGGGAKGVRSSERIRVSVTFRGRLLLHGTISAAPNRSQLFFSWLEEKERVRES